MEGDSQYTPSVFSTVTAQHMSIMFFKKKFTQGTEEMVYYLKCLLPKPKTWGQIPSINIKNQTQKCAVYNPEPWWRWHRNRQIGAHS